MKDYFILEQSRVITGPHSAKGLLRILEEGGIGRDLLVAINGRRNWQPLSAVLRTVLSEAGKAAPTAPVAEAEKPRSSDEPRNPGGNAVPAWEPAPPENPPGVHADIGQGPVADFMHGAKVMTNYHLTPGEDGWKLSREDSDRVIDVFRTKEDAVSACGGIITERDGGKGSLKIHRSDGTIEEERTYPRSADPRETAG